MAHIRIMNTRRNANGAITAITQPNRTAEMGLQYRNIIIIPARTDDKGVVDVAEIGSSETQRIHAVRLGQYMGKGTGGLWEMPEQFEGENEGITIPTQVQWLANARTIMERTQNGGLATS